MWPSYCWRDATLSPCSTHGHCWQIYSQCQCMPCYFIKLIYSVRRDACKGAGPDVPLHRHPDLNLYSTSVWHIHYNPPSLHWFSHQLCQHMARVCIMALFTRRLLSDAGGVKLQATFAIWNLPGLALNLCAVFLQFHTQESAVIDKRLLGMRVSGYVLNKFLSWKGIALFRLRVRLFDRWFSGAFRCNPPADCSLISPIIYESRFIMHSWVTILSWIPTERWMHYFTGWSYSTGKSQCWLGQPER